MTIGTVVRVSPWRLSVSSASPSCMKPLMNNTNKTKFATAFIMDHPQTFLTALPADEHRESRRNFLGMVRWHLYLLTSWLAGWFVSSV